MSKKISKIGKRFLLSFSTFFLLTFMVLIFGPAEIFFSNSGDFKFVYGEFAGRMAGIAIVISIVLALVIAFLPEKVRKVFVSLVFGISIAGYVQVMFINKNLDLLGLNPDGYTPNPGQAVVNGIVWIAFIAVAIALAFWKDKIWTKLVAYGSVFLILIQAVALVSLMVTAPKTAYEHEADASWYISGKDQFTVSANENVIVFILDWFSNQALEPALEAYPDLLDEMHDFTYYNNADCTFFGTYPSLAHMMSGLLVNPTVSINEWTSQIWTAESTQGFFQELRDKNYVSNLYTPDKNMICAMNDVSVMEGTFSNLDNAGQDLVVDYDLLIDTMTKISCYRFAPYALKSEFYVSVNAYTDVVRPRENRVYHNNHEFYEKLLEKGLSKDTEHNYYVVQHLMGPHAYQTTADGHYAEKSSLEETIKGCMVIVGEYLRQLKELGVYDNATIIVTSDHGGARDSQVVFFMKEPNEKHDTMQETHAPIGHTDYQATIARAAGLDYEKYGQAVTDIPEDVPRERIIWVRLLRPELPDVPKYDGSGEGVSNAYCGFAYIGDINDLFERYDAGPSVVIPETDCFN